MTQEMLDALSHLCSADGPTHTESNKLYRKVKHRYRPNLSPRQRPTAKARLDQAALAASAEARGATHRARPPSSTDSTRSTHFTLPQWHRWKETDGKVCTHTHMCICHTRHIPTEMQIFTDSSSPFFWTAMSATLGLTRVNPAMSATLRVTPRLCKNCSTTHAHVCVYIYIFIIHTNESTTSFRTAMSATLHDPEVVQELLYSLLHLDTHTVCHVFLYTFSIFTNAKTSSYAQ